MLAGLIAFVGGVYVAVVVVPGVFVDRADAPNMLLSVAATAIVAVGFERARGTLRGWASRLSGRPHPLPYDVLARFAADSGFQVAAEQTSARMARVLAAGVGASRVEVWLLAGDRMTLAAISPENAGVPPAPRTRSTARHRRLAGMSAPFDTAVSCWVSWSWRNARANP